MGGNGDCGCGGSCKGNGKNGNGGSGARGRTPMNGSNERSAFMAGPYLVRKPAALTPTAVTGDGKGSENPVPVGGANQVVLLIDANKSSVPSTQALDVSMEVSVNGTDFYRSTDVATGATAQVTKKTYEVAASVLITGDDRIAISIPVLAAFARFTFVIAAGANNYTNVACRALTGRV